MPCTHAFTNPQLMGLMVIGFYNQLWEGRYGGSMWLLQKMMLCHTPAHLPQTRQSTHRSFSLPNNMCSPSSGAQSFFQAAAITWNTGQAATCWFGLGRDTCLQCCIPQKHICLILNSPFCFPPAYISLSFKSLTDESCSQLNNLKLPLVRATSPLQCLRLPLQEEENLSPPQAGQPSLLVPLDTYRNITPTWREISRLLTAYIYGGGTVCLYHFLFLLTM